MNKKEFKEILTLGKNFGISGCSAKINDEIRWLTFDEYVDRLAPKYCTDDTKIEKAIKIIENYPEGKSLQEVINEIYYGLK